MFEERSSVVVVGAGAAGHAAARTLRAEGFAGRLVLVHGEPGRPYNRTLVDKALLQGVLTADQATLLPLDDLDVEIVHSRAVALDARASTVALADGRTLPFAALVVATGSAPRADGLARAGERGVRHLHTLQDVTAVRRLLDDGDLSRATVLGAGFIGSEVAGVLADQGVAVSLVSRAAVPLAGALGEPLAARIAHLHREHVDTRFGRHVERVTPGERQTEVELDDGTRLTSDLVVVAHGTAPAAGWARHGGIRVDERLRALGMPRVYAAGGVALHSTETGEAYRVDHWDAASAQGAHAARTILHDLVAASDPGPYVPSTGFTFQVHGVPVAGRGVVPPGAVVRHRAVDDSDAILTTFHRPDGALVGAAGLRAARPLLALRHELARP